MTKKRDTRMAAEKFIPLYLEAVEAGTTREEFAKQIGVSPLTVYQRIYEMHQKGACKKTFPQLSTNGRRSFIDRINAAVEDWQKSKGKELAKPDKPEPKAKAKAKKQEEPTPPAEDEGSTEGDKFLESLLNG
jgi:predicted transcriptional regulator